MTSPPDGAVNVQFISAETACSHLAGAAVAVVTHDGVKAVGILERHFPRDGTETMVHIYDIITDELILGTDIRNFKEIVVP